MKDFNNFNTDGINDAEIVRLPYFDWDKAKTFYYIAKLGSFSEAAKFLNTAQSGLSRKVQVLEDHLKCKLFVRTPKGVELTRKGEEFFSIIEQSFLLLKGFSYNNVTTTNDGKKRKIKIATTHALATQIFSTLIIEYNKQNPHLVFDLICEDSDLDIILNDIDITIRPISYKAGDLPQEDLQGAQKEYLFTLQKKLFASEKYIEIYGEPKTVEELRDHNTIVFGRPQRHPYADVNWILRQGMPEGKLHEPVFTSNSIECMIKAAQEGLGIVAIYGEMDIVRESGLKNILPDVIGEEIQEYILYPSHLAEDHDIIDFKNYLIKKLKKSTGPKIAANA